METKEQTSEAGTATTPRNRTITVNVRAHVLFYLPPTDNNIDDNTSLIEDGGLESRYGDKNADFETDVFMNKDITWNIVTADPRGADNGYSVALTSIAHKPKTGNPEFFSKNPLTPGRDGTVTGTISLNPNLPNKDDSYTINFTITYNGRTNPYPLDPKLKILTGQ